MGATKTLLTFEEFEHLPDQPGKCELLEGELIELPPGELRHNRLSQRLFKLLDAALEAAHSRGEATELGEACHEMGYKLANNAYVQPDVSITHAGQPEGKYFGGPPAIAIEVISPSNTVEAMDIKTKLYFQDGAREVWRVHCRTRHIMVFLPGGLRRLSEDDNLTTPLLPSLCLPVRGILGE